MTRTFPPLEGVQGRRSHIPNLRPPDQHRLQVPRVCVSSLFRHLSGAMRSFQPLCSFCVTTKWRHAYRGHGDITWSQNEEHDAYWWTVCSPHCGWLCDFVHFICLYITVLLNEVNKPTKTRGMNLINATHFNTHIYSDNPLFKPFCSLIYILCFTDLARKKISVFWCTFLKCKTRKRLNWIFF